VGAERDAADQAQARVVLGRGRVERPERRPHEVRARHRLRRDQPVPGRPQRPQERPPDEVGRGPGPGQHHGHLIHKDHLSGGPGHSGKDPAAQCV
jgi:hypothetical protein